MTPLIDVVFLLLTFFIYSLIMTVHAEIVPVSISPLESGTPAKVDDVSWVSIDSEGRYYLNREPVTIESLNESLQLVAKEKPDATLYVVVDGDADMNLWPPFLQLIDRARAVGVSNISIVGRSKIEKENSE